MKGSKKYDFTHKENAKYENELKFRYLFNSNGKYLFNRFCGMNINKNSLYNMY
ncbi:MAG: hypothetical protein IKG40_03595 [Bacilli bacterium]|nr:hypothetical protein [Bacilli bacterium]